MAILTLRNISVAVVASTLLFAAAAAWVWTGWQETPADEPYDAAHSGNIDLARRALDEGADINAPERLGQNTPLIGAAGDGMLEMVKFPLSRGADPTLTDYDGLMAWAAARPGEIRSILERQGQGKARPPHPRPDGYRF
jgi:hypothetical protein